MVSSIRLAHDPEPIRSGKRSVKELSQSSDAPQTASCRRIYNLMLLLKAEIGTEEAGYFDTETFKRIQSKKSEPNGFRSISLKGSNCTIRVDRAFVTFCRLKTLQGSQTSFTVQDTISEQHANRSWWYQRYIFSKVTFTVMDDSDDAEISFDLPAQIAKNPRFNHLSESEAVDSISAFFSTIISNHIGNSVLKRAVKYGFDEKKFKSICNPYNESYNGAIHSLFPIAASSTTRSEPASSSESPTSSSIPRQMRPTKRQRILSSQYTPSQIIAICHRIYFFAELFTGDLNQDHFYKFEKETWNRLKQLQKTNKLIRLTSLKDGHCTVIADFSYIMYHRNRSKRGCEGQSLGPKKSKDVKKSHWLVADQKSQDRLALKVWLKKSADLFQPVSFEKNSSLHIPTEWKISFKLPVSTTCRTLAGIGKVLRAFLKLYIHAEQRQGIQSHGFAPVKELRGNYAPFSYCLANPTIGQKEQVLR